jgi:hypothetical protein
VGTVDEQNVHSLREVPRRRLQRGGRELRGKDQLSLSVDNKIINTVICVRLEMLSV